MEEHLIKILYVDDEIHNLKAFKAYFRTRDDFEIYTCQSGEQGLTILNGTEISVIISDQKMPEMTGVEFIEKAALKYPDPVKIVVTAHREVSPLKDAYDKGLIFAYHEKPWNFDDLEKSIEEGFKIYLQKLKK